MPAGPMTRRTLVTCALAMPFASAHRRAVALASEEPLQRLLATSQSEDGAILLPAGGEPLQVHGPIIVPSGTTLIVRRDLVGGPRAKLRLGDRTTVRFEGARVQDVALCLERGTIHVSGLNYTGRAHLAAITIHGPGPYRNLVFEDFRISDANFGILRQGANSALLGGVIRRGTFTRLSGDAIEWNICPHDSGLILEDHDIAGVDAPEHRPFWGIGIGIAGAAYSANWGAQSSARNFVIRRITGRALRQLIHVEAATDFAISDIQGHDISERYSTHSGIENAVVVCYGSRRFTIEDVVADAPILLMSGAVHGQYVVPCADITLDRVHLTRGDVRAELGGAKSNATLRRIKLAAGSVIVKGMPARLTLDDLDVVSRDPQTQPLRFDPEFLSGSLADFRPTKPVVTRRAIRVRHHR